MSNKELIIGICICLVIIFPSLLIINKLDKKYTMEEQMNMQKLETKKSLIVYYSMNGKTESVAKYISEKIDSDILEIKSVKAYPTNHEKFLEYSRKEKMSGILPEIEEFNGINPDNYSTIFVGYPIWWSTLATPMCTFLAKYKFINTRIIPFAITDNFDAAKTLKTLKLFQPYANIETPLTIDVMDMKNYKERIDIWLRNLDFIKDSICVD